VAFPPLPLACTCDGIDSPTGDLHTISSRPCRAYTTSALYGLGILDAGDPNGNLVWPAGNSLQGASIGSTSYPIPANSLTAGSRFVIVGIATEVPISGAAVGSGFVVQTEQTSTWRIRIIVQ